VREPTSPAYEVPRERGPTLPDLVDRDALAAACRRHHIQWLAVFGSHARGDARPESDVDVLVDFAPGMTPGFGIVRVAEALRPIFGGRRVDLVTRRGLAPRLRDGIVASARALYAAG
jgi:predicted nucleotidyltransferase